MVSVVSIPPLWLTILILVLLGTGVGIYLQSNISSVGASTSSFVEQSTKIDNSVNTSTLLRHEIPVPNEVSAFLPIPSPPQIPGAQFPHIEPQGGSGVSTIQITSAFPFGSFGNATISVPVNIAVYRGAKNADKNITLYTGVSDETVLRTYYLGFMADSHQDPFFESLLREFQKYRKQWNLDNDSYLELLAMFVQSIPYRVQDGGSRFPIETFVEYQGDCDDKALLLASLLAREGYNVSILYFKEERHVALGIASNTMIYGTTGYSYLETTVPSLVGVPPVTINGGNRTPSTPIVIPVAFGAVRYEKGDQVARILVEEEAAYQGIRTALPDVLIERQDLIDRIRNGELEAQYLSQNNQDGGYASFQHNLGIYCYIHTHPHDRQGTYLWVLNGSPQEPVLCP